MSTAKTTSTHADTIFAKLQKIVGTAGSFDAVRPKILTCLKAEQERVGKAALVILQKTGDGVACARAFCAGQDQVLLAICQLVADVTEGGWPEQVSLGATGGYGRGELAPGSDLDLLFLIQKGDAQKFSTPIEQVLYLLWDCGLKVGHAVRLEKECQQLVNADHTIGTAMMDLRPLFGPEIPIERLSKALRKKYNSRSNIAFITDKLRERDARHEKQGSARYVVEPNVKEGKGALRDLQSLVWIARRIDPEAFVAGGSKPTFFTPEEYRTFERANRFLWTVRCWLHFLTRRDEDRLTFDMQPIIAKKLKYRDGPEQPGVERLMKAYFLNAREVGFLTRIFCTKLEERAAKPAPRGLSRWVPVRRRRIRQMDQAGFVLFNGRLAFEDRVPKPDQPAQLVQLFLLADKAAVDIHPDALAHVRRAVPGLPKTVRKNPELIEPLIECLTEAHLPETLLRLMAETGLLGKLVPEFGRIIAQTQFNMYHSYTVDEHTLRAIGVLRKLENGRMQLDGIDMGALLAKSKNRRVLYLAMLLHDTGKGLGDQEVAGGIATRTACARMGLSVPEVELAGWLVENHLLYSDTAQGRDLADPETISRFAAKIKSLERLRLLFALTVADIRAVGPEVWTGWKGQLLVDLYMQTESYLLGRLNRDMIATQKESQIVVVHKKLQKALPDPVFWKFWREEPDDRYWLEFSHDQLLAHAKMVRKASKQQQGPGFELLAGSGQHLTTMVVWAEDQPGLFAGLCAVATASGAEIASARISTTSSDRAFDVLHLHDGRGGPFAANNPRALLRLTEMLGTYFETGQAPISQPRRRTRREAAFTVMPEVVIDNEISRRATLIECVGADRVGLLFNLAQTLNQCGVNIHSAHITTYGERAVDIFYVNEKNGQKIKNARRLAHIRKKLLQIIQPILPDHALGPVRQALASRDR
ncbi:MAG: [protein-PII] uridylyltransferase [Robiginitomaculum sp.]|nr:MAG: [protein-PII] uridylyltransferase [Robiginitomaculum sp.]